MSENNSTIMELYYLERVKLEPHNRGKWILEAERWHELGRAWNFWRFQKAPLQQSMHTEPTAIQHRQQR